MQGLYPLMCYSCIMRRKRALRTSEWVVIWALVFLILAPGGSAFEIKSSFTEKDDTEETSDSTPASESPATTELATGSEDTSEETSSESAFGNFSGLSGPKSVSHGENPDKKEFKLGQMTTS